MARKQKRFGGGGGVGRSAYQGNENSYTQESDLDASDSVGKGAMSRQLAAANAEKPVIGPVKEYPKGRDLDAVEMPTFTPAPAATPISMPTRPGQNVSGVMPVKKPVAPVSSGRKPSVSQETLKLDALNSAYKPRSSVGGGRGGQGGAPAPAAPKSSNYTPRRDPNAKARMALSRGDSDEAGNDMKRGGKVKKMATGGSVGSASKRGDGIAQRGKTRGMVC